MLEASTIGSPDNASRNAVRPVGGGRAAVFAAAVLVGGLLSAGCKPSQHQADGDAPQVCENLCEIPADGSAPNCLQCIDSSDDFCVLASAPNLASISGAFSAKVALDQSDGDAFYVQNSNKYGMHYDFVSDRENDFPPPIPALRCAPIQRIASGSWASSSRSFTRGPWRVSRTSSRKGSPSRTSMISSRRWSSVQRAPSW